jgi:exosome complex component RRP42
VLLLSPPQSYPLPLLSLTTHLALLSTRLPKLKSQGEEDPFFEDDWNLAEYLYPHPESSSFKKKQNNQRRQARPPVTLLVTSMGKNVIFDPTREEISVADAVLAVSIGREQDAENADANLKLLSIRTIDPPSRLTQHGVPDTENAATLSAVASSTTAATEIPPATDEEVPGVWKPRRGGVSRSVISKIIKLVLAKGGVGDEVMEGLEGVEVS